MLLTVCVSMCELGTSSQAPKSGRAKSNSDHGKSVTASINNPIYRRGQCSQSTVGITRWTNSHQHQQHTSSSSTVCPFLAVQMQENNHRSNVIMCLHAWPILFFCRRLKSKPYRLGEKYEFLLEKGAVANNNYFYVLLLIIIKKRCTWCPRQLYLFENM